MSYRLDNLFLRARYWIINIDILYIPYWYDSQTKDLIWAYNVFFFKYNIVVNSGILIVDDWDNGVIRPRS